MKKHLFNVLLWSVVAAAFVGPGTVTTAAAAGAQFQTALLWALTFSVVACVVLQEAVARLNAVTQLSLGEVLVKKYPHHLWIAYVAGGMVVFGCIAYQAGNILGAVKGVSLVSYLPPKTVTLLIISLCFVMLWSSSHATIARILGIFVGGMGILFIAVAWYTPHNLTEITQGAFIPSLPESSTTLAVGLVGTTIVPYNLFLASGLAQGQSIKEMRISLGISILLGGIVSAAVLLAGTLLTEAFSFEALGEVIMQRLGQWGFAFFGIGLFAAGFTSSVTAPLASALTASSLAAPHFKKRIYRLTWVAVLLIGGIFGMLDIKPIPAIILAQAINGLLLPFITVFVFLAVNDSTLLPPEHRNPFISNLLMLVVLGVTTFLGFNHLLLAFEKMGIGIPSPYKLPLLLSGVFALVSWAGFRIFQEKKRP